MQTTNPAKLVAGTFVTGFSAGFFQSSSTALLPNVFLCQFNRWGVVP